MDLAGAGRPGASAVESAMCPSAQISGSTFNSYAVGGEVGTRPPWNQNRNPSALGSVVVLFASGSYDAAGFGTGILTLL